MPKPLSAQADDVVYLHAAWWSAKTTRLAQPVWVLTQEDDPDPEPGEASPDTTDTNDDAATQDAERWVLRQTVEAPVEHYILKRHLRHTDTKAVEAIILAELKFKRGGQRKPSPKQLARYKTLSYTKRVLEMTDADGVTYPITEATFDDLEEKEMTFLAAAIEQLDDPVTPILVEDIRAADAKAAHIEDAVTRQFTVSDEDEAFADMPYEQQNAVMSRERVFRPALRAVSGED